MIVLNELLPSLTPRCACIGCFDGIHLGHKSVILKTVYVAKQKNYSSLVYTFSPFKNKGSLLQEDKKISKISDLGIMEYYSRQFTPEFAAMDPESFVLHLKQMSVVHVVVGQDFTFGKGGIADSGSMMNLCQKHGLSVDIVPLVMQNGEKISSTSILSAIDRGDIDTVEAMLGGKYEK